MNMKTPQEKRRERVTSTVSDIMEKVVAGEAKIAKKQKLDTLLKSVKMIAGDEHIINCLRPLFEDEDSRKSLFLAGDQGARVELLKELHNIYNGAVIREEADKDKPSPGHSPRYRGAGATRVKQIEAGIRGRK